MFANDLVDIQLKEALSILNEKLAKVKLLPEQQRLRQDIDYQEYIEELETGISKFPEMAKPWIEQQADWESYLKRYEDSFYDNEITKPILPITVSKIGRNDPCYCGSGKKYKKCHGNNIG